MSTSLSVRECRAQLVHEQLLASQRPVERVEGIASLPGLASWRAEIVDHAVADLVADGLLTEAPDGALHVHRRAER